MQVPVYAEASLRFPQLIILRAIFDILYTAMAVSSN